MAHDHTPELTQKQIQDVFELLELGSEEQRLEIVQHREWTTEEQAREPLILTTLGNTTDTH